MTLSDQKGKQIIRDNIQKCFLRYFRTISIAQCSDKSYLYCSRGVPCRGKHVGRTPVGVDESINTPNRRRRDRQAACSITLTPARAAENSRISTVEPSRRGLVGVLYYIYFCRYSAQHPILLNQTLALNTTLLKINAFCGGQL
jgi:hypothetical protein